MFGKIRKALREAERKRIEREAAYRAHEQGRQALIEFATNMSKTYGMQWKKAPWFREWAVKYADMWGYGVS